MTEMSLVEVPQSQAECTIAGRVFRKVDPPHPDTPAWRPYIFPEAEVRDISVALKHKLNVLITGPTGCGKTSLPIALAHELGRPVIRFNLNGETRVSGLVGMNKPAAVDGALTLQFSYGALVRGLKNGYWIILDEIDAAPPGVLMVLQPVLEEGNARLHIPETDEQIQAHPDAMIFATGNTLGYRASARARHAGTHMMNAAFLDRFGMVVAADYPERVDEIQRIQAHVQFDEQKLAFVDGVCRVADKLRKDSSFRSDFSTRRLIQWARLLPDYDFDVKTTFELAVGRKLESATDVKVARETMMRIFGYD